MSDFQYIARGLTGQQVGGVLSAGSEQEALAMLAGRSLFPVELKLAPEAAAVRRRRTKRVRAKHLAITYSQLADLLRAGVPLLRSLELLEHKSQHGGLRTVLAAVRADVAEGTRLADAMGKHPKVFSELAVSMVRAGEEGAFVEDVLKRIADFTDHQEMLKSRVTGAMVYPIFLMVMGTVVVIAMLTFFVPKFTPIFERMSSKGTLPAATTWLLGPQRYAAALWNRRPVDRGRRRDVRDALGENRRRSPDRRPDAAQGLRHRPDFSQFCHFAVLPHSGNAVAKRRSDSRVAPHRQGRHGKPRAQ